MILHQTRVLDYETCKASAKRFKTRNEFSHGDSVAYRKCHKMGWIDEFFPARLKSMPPIYRRPRRKLTYDECKQSALQATSRTDWRNKDDTAYEKACRNGWIADFFPDKIVRKSEVTLEKCLEIRELLRSQGKNSISDFINYNGNLYAQALRNGWIEQLGFQDKHISFKEAGLRRQVYNFDDALKIAKQYDTLYEFRTKQKSLYKWCSKEGYMDKFPWLVSQRTEYNEDMIRTTVAKYTDYTKFCKENSAMYQYMSQHHLLYLADSLERKVQYRDGYAIDCVYVYEFSDVNYAYVGRTINLANRNWDHHCRKDDTVYRFATAHNIDVPEPKILAENITVKEGPKIESKMIELYRAIGWNMINSVHGGSLGGLGYQKKWTMKALTAAASQFEYWDDFENFYSGAVQKIRKYKMMDKFPWLKYKKTPSGKWKNVSKEDAYEIAKTFSNRQAFADSYKSLYVSALSRGWIDEWFNKSNGKQPLTARRRVMQYSANGELIATHDSIAAAANAIGIKPSHVSYVCRWMPMRGICNGYLFKYEDDSYAATPDECKAHFAKLRERHKAYHKAFSANNHDIIVTRRRAAYNKRTTAGYRYRKNKDTGKMQWVLVDPAEKITG